ncbi:GTPase domain-containing protein [Egicoccus halophilus]|uniref:ABC transporter n=1 Tax=Egicoccus halophilus TaxID=1670830 RepID=A0A8J3ESJ6_9ACTN|nr:GTPase domain-containing protein [Egicoccus halophilus]GGI03508.1 ABC transporter [Egicoccus halophilus]
MSDAAALERLAGALEALRFELSADAGERLRRSATATTRLLRATVARAADPDAPLLVVVAGGTGAGKSTTVNTLAGAQVAATGVVRPTTHAPVLVCHPDDEAALVDSRLLPHLPRVRGDDGRHLGARLVVRTAPGLPPGLALVDTPDVDSVQTDNRHLAEDVLDVADAWLWFVTGRTYADEVGAGYLRLARDRQAVTAVVVTQLRPGDRDEILADVERLLTGESVPVGTIVDVPASEVVDGRLPPAAVAGLQAWLTGLAADGAREEVRRRALAGLRAAVPGELGPVVAALDAQDAAADRLEATVDAAYGRVEQELSVELERGIPMRADVLDRWRDLVGGGETLLRVQTAAARVRTMVRGLLGNADDAAESPRQVRVEVADTLTETIQRLLERAAWDARRRLEQDPAGRQLLDQHPTLREEDPERRHRIRAAVDAWGDHVAELVATVGADRRVQARVWSTALNAVATAAILVVFTVSGGLTGGELGIAALASAGSQALLVRLFGEQNLRRLLEDANEDLSRRVTEVVAQDRAVVDGAVAAARPDPDAAATVRAAADPRS